MLRALTLAFLCFGQPLWANSLEMIIDRSERGVELFISLAAEEAPAILGTDVATLEGMNVGVDYTVLQNGTWDQGDALFTNVASQLGGSRTTFEAMSMMVHPRDLPQSFLDPIDALTAISVCGVPIPEVPPPLNEMHVYAGFIAFPADGAAPLSLSLGNTDPVNLTVRSFDREGNVAVETLRIDANQAFTILPPSAEAQQSLPLAIALLVLSALLVAGLTGVWLRQRKSAPAI